MSNRHLTSVDSLPPLRKDTLYLFSSRYSPYGKSVQALLEHKGIAYTLINIHTRNKPPEYFTKSPNGMVPAIQYNDKVIYESTIIMEYLDRVYPEPNLTPEEPYQIARGQIIVMEFMKAIAIAKEVLKADKDNLPSLDGFYASMEAFCNYLPDTRFLCGDEVSIYDYICWPLAQWLHVHKPVFGWNALPDGRFLKFRRWMDNVGNTHGVKTTMLPIQELIEFWNRRAKGNWTELDYDFAQINK